MTRGLVGLLSICALGLGQLVGCSESSPQCRETVCPCNEGGIRDAILKGGGPYTFECDGETTVTTGAEIVIDKDVILDGGGNLVVDGADDHRVFTVEEGVVAELEGLQLTRGSDQVELAGGILNKGTLTLTDSSLFMNPSGGLNNFNTATVSNCVFNENLNRGITNQFAATMVLTESTVSGNRSLPGDDGDSSDDEETFGRGGGIWTDGDLIMTGSAISGNMAARRGGGIYNSGDLILINSTVSGNSAEESGGGVHGDDSEDGLIVINTTVVDNSSPEGSAISSEGNVPITLANSIFEGTCAGPVEVISSGYNIESPGDTCALEEATDQVGVTEAALNLGPLDDNGGSTKTHALLPGSVAIDVVPTAACRIAEDEPLTTDQRSEPRPAGDSCDVGAFELQP